MFKDEYNKQFEDISPSPALNEETLALMQEAQAHPAPAPAPKKLLPWVLPVCVSGAAAMLALTVGLSFWLSRPDAYNDIMGDPYDELFMQAGTSSDSNNMGSAPPSSEDNSSANTDADPSAPQDDNSTSKPQPENETTAPGDTSNGATSAPATPENNKPENDSYSDEDNNGGSSSKPDSDDDAEDSNSTPPLADEKADDDKNESEPGETPPAEPIDPRKPVVINDAKTETYLSIRDYLDALAAKKTIGYKKNYLGDSSLVIVPSWLPQTARFRHFYAYSNGGYAYSYLISDGKTEYFLDISVSATPPKTMRDLNLRTRGIKTEEIGVDKVGNRRIFYFGNYDEAAVTVTTLDGKKPSQKTVDTLLNPFDLARYTTQNGLLDATYE